MSNKVFDTDKWIEMVCQIASYVTKEEYRTAIEYIDKCIFSLNYDYRVIDLQYTRKLEGMQLLIAHLHTEVTINEKDR